MYFAFLIHHIGMLIIPGFFGLPLWGYHLYLATQHTDEEGNEVGIITSYFEILDTPVNYIFLVFLALWITFYIESWKRKQNTLKHMWATESRKHEI